MQKQRLSKYLASAGVASRRSCEELIFAHKVSVNDVVTSRPQTLVSDEDQITVRGKCIQGCQEKVYYMLNKPTGYICSTLATGKSQSVLSLLKESRRLFTVGRLDVETSGLLLVTNDGHFSQKIAHPSAKIEKEYVATVKGPLGRRQLAAISAGTVVEGRRVTPRNVKKIAPQTVVIVVTDGRKREVRCLIKNAGLTVITLMRTRIGGLELGDLPHGRWRCLTHQEKEQIFQ